MEFWHLQAAVIAPTLLIAACGGSAPDVVPALGNCMTEEGWADWTGPCFLGQAEGKGIATYEDGLLATIEGLFDGGIPQGEVEITYSSGAKYSGSLKDGEYHGFGTLQESWGEAYSGNWNEGFRDGIGRYTGQDGKIVEGLWDHGRLIGSWFSATNTDCEVWWAGTGSDPVGTLAWDGACVNGRANGPGKIDWTDETPEAASGATIQFSGTLSGGKLNGEGVWTQTNRYSNVIHRKVSKGIWVDGAREGYGTDVEESEFLDGSFEGATTTYSGGWENGKFSGEGERVNTKTYNDGGVESEKEQGSFVEGTLRQGVATRQRRVVKGEDSTEMVDGRFESRQFIGFGTVVTRRRVDTAYYHSIVRYDGPTTDGGEGIIQYANGDTFIGSMKAEMGWSGSPLLGRCVLPSIGFIGRCKSTSVTLSHSERKICLSPVNDEGQCLKEIARFIS